MQQDMASLTGLMQNKQLAHYFSVFNGFEVDHAEIFKGISVSKVYVTCCSK